MLESGCNCTAPFINKSVWRRGVWRLRAWSSLDGQSVKATEQSSPRGFDEYKRVKGRKRHILVGPWGS
jgi:hypothetical protein